MKFQNARNFLCFLSWQTRAKEDLARFLVYYLTQCQIFKYPWCLLLTLSLICTVTHKPEFTDSVSVSLESCNCIKDNNNNCAWERN